MKNLMTTNIYDVRGSIAVAGACLESVQPEGFRAATEDLDEVYSLCLEETHINMAVTKLGAMLSTGQIQKLVFVSVDRSPHCTQLHYIKHELERMMTLNAEVLDALQITLPGGLVVDSHASRFTDYGEYELVVIDRGMAVMHELRAMVGRETFLEALGRYVSGNAGRIASIEQFVAAFNETTGSTWGEYIVAQMHDIGD